MALPYIVGYLGNNAAQHYKSGIPNVGVHMYGDIRKLKKKEIVATRGEVKTRKKLEEQQ